ncbi:restriction endonuclease subunit S [Thermolongibacillus altinsuensis]|uniref:restriction endonuclease subunit S n=1 Tax=Thermolongibacillus altinsuensis TaxID=575256 RepID=UPI0014049704|nr:restriction endonuclease subunit S [Thermolongibacillus altinsuensis]
MSKPERKQVPQPLKSIPNDWDFEQLGKLIDFKNGYAFNSSNYTEEGKIILRMSNISKEGKLQFREDNIKYCSEEEYNHLESFHLKEGDLVICMTDVTPEKAIIGRTAVIDADNKYILNQRVGRIRITEGERILGSFLHYFTNFDLYLKFMRERCSGSAQFNLSTSEIKSVYVPLPPIAEQRKIAAILSSVDEAIEKTEAIIEQTEKVKKGLMQQLLTKGIGHTKFKKTEIGEIPEEWEVKTIGEIGSLKSGTTPSREKAELYYKSGEIPWVKTMDLNNSFIVDTHEKVTNLALEETSLSIIPKGSVLVAMYGGFNQIGRTGLLKIDATINQALTAILINTELIEPEFLLIWLNYKVNHWKKFAASSRKDPNITKNDVANFPVVIPSLEEQRKIYTTILNISKKIENEIIKKQQLQIIKKGLMQVLLTGKVRVKVDNEVMSQ